MYACRGRYDGINGLAPRLSFSRRRAVAGTAAGALSHWRFGGECSFRAAKAAAASCSGPRRRSCQVPRQSCRRAGWALARKRCSCFCQAPVQYDPHCFNLQRGDRGVRLLAQTHTRGRTDETDSRPRDRQETFSFNVAYQCNCDAGAGNSYHAFARNDGS